MQQYRFHEFTVDVAQRSLIGADGTPVELTPRLFDGLLFLVEHPGELLTKDALLAALWPGLVVEENSLSQAISALRRALGDDAQNSRFIQTVQRRGFRFVAPVEVFDAAADAPSEAITPLETREKPAAQADRRRLLVGATAGTLLVAAAGAGAAAWW